MSRKRRGTRRPIRAAPPAGALRPATSPRRLGRVALLVGIGLAFLGVLAGAGAVLARPQEPARSATAGAAGSATPSPEKLATLEQPALELGQAFPDFTATEVDGRRITRESLRGKPAVVWFTTAYCVPCQVGARVVSKLDDELGGGAFDVVVLFVDPNESPADLHDWRRQFARPDWMVARDVGLAKRVELRYLDTKYLLDRAGVIRNIDVAIADEHYLELIRQVVREGR